VTIFNAYFFVSAILLQQPTRHVRYDTLGMHCVLPWLRRFFVKAKYHLLLCNLPLRGAGGAALIRRRNQYAAIATVARMLSFEGTMTEMCM